MRKVIAAINMTLDGYCDHTAITPDEEIHEHYSTLLKASGTALYGRITYELMKYWQPMVKNPTGNKSMDEFATAIDEIPKIVFSHTLKNTGWETARLANRDIREEVSALKEQPGKDILVGSPGLIVTMTNLGLIDEYQLCIHPVIVGSGLPLFKNINERITFKLIRTKTFVSGAVIHYYSCIK
ncbi:dihydrofolate reductase family protein [Polluticaenibacter yanchengensis]|uniref:Dihydrofolate reductase family protein n=1 Tax=Polluticaenibacter yanchengensis TaxID=3014562 RepID=A0ABT4UN02_9BACT|nr:dihydrofolate reductase family protein [Chitinophagaceae bacterium LY-5]